MQSRAMDRAGLDMAEAVVTEDRSVLDREAEAAEAVEADMAEGSALARVAESLMQGRIQGTLHNLHNLRIQASRPGKRVIQIHPGISIEVIRDKSNL
jgi:hypothetical protein